MVWLLLPRPEWRTEADCQPWLSEVDLKRKTHRLPAAQSQNCNLFSKLLFNLTIAVQPGDVQWDQLVLAGFPVQGWALAGRTETLLSRV